MCQSLVLEQRPGLCTVLHAFLSSFSSSPLGLHAAHLTDVACPPSCFKMFSQASVEIHSSEMVLGNVLMYRRPCCPQGYCSLLKAPENLFSDPRTWNLRSLQQESGSGHISLLALAGRKLRSMLELQDLSSAFFMSLFCYCFLSWGIF